MNASTSTSEVTVSPATTSAATLAQLGAALLLGLVMLYATGFSEASVAHNAAHDMRHANGRPCH